MPSASASASHGPPHSPRASAGFRHSRSLQRDAVTATDAALVKDVAVTVAISFRDVSASALVDLARSVAHATGVELSDTWVDVVADAISVRIGLTRPTAFSEGVKLVSVAVAVSSRDAVTATDAALVKDVAVAVASPSGMSAHPHS